MWEWSCITFLQEQSIMNVFCVLKKFILLGEKFRWENIGKEKEKLELSWFDLDGIEKRKNLPQMDLVGNFGPFQQSKYDICV